MGLGAKPAISPLECRDDKTYSLIDASLFRDPRNPRDPNDDQLYLLYKRDDDGGPIQDDIVIRRVDPDGRSNPGPPTQLVVAERGTWEGFSVEAPTMIFRNGRYYLFYSGANYARDTYAVGVAVSSVESNRPDSKLVKYPGNPILRGEVNEHFCGVGHQDVTNVPGDGWLLFYHAYRGGAGKNGDCVESKRYLMMDPLRWDQAGGARRVSDFWPSVGRPNRTPSGTGMTSSQEGPEFRLPPAPGSVPGPAQPSGSTARLRVGGVRPLGARILRFQVRNSTVVGAASVSVLRGPETVARSSRAVTLGAKQKMLDVPLNRRLEPGRYVAQMAVTNAEGVLLGLDSAKLRVP